MNNICSCCGKNYGPEKLPRHEDFQGPICDGCLGPWVRGFVHPMYPRWQKPEAEKATGLTESGFEKLEWAGGYSYNSEADETEL